MAETKTKPTNASVSEFLEKTTDGQRREDAQELIRLFEQATGLQAHMWGPSIIGFGSYHYKYASGHEGDAPIAGFSPRKDAFALYFSSEYENRDALMAKLGKHKAAKACVYVKKLADVDTAVLKEMIVKSVAHTRALYPAE